MKAIKDLRFTSGFLTKNDKNAILNWINENENLFLSSCNYMIYTEVHLQHHNTMLYISVIGAGMLAIGKVVDNGKNYLYNEYCNFLVK